MRRHLGNQRGIGLAELVVAMAVIVAVSVTAMSMITRFSKLSTKMTKRNESISIAEKCMECFLYTDNKRDFDTWVQVVVGVDFDITEEVLYAYEFYGYTITMKVNYYETYATFMANVKDENDRYIYKIPKYERYY